jgi:hypothetical protein
VGTVAARRRHRPGDSSRPRPRGRHPCRLRSRPSHPTFPCPPLLSSRPKTSRRRLVDLTPMPWPVAGRGAPHVNVFRLFSPLPRRPRAVPVGTHILVVRCGGSPP